MNAQAPIDAALSKKKMQAEGRVVNGMRNADRFIVERIELELVHKSLLLGGADDSSCGHCRNPNSLFLSQHFIGPKALYNLTAFVSGHHVT